MSNDIEREAFERHYASMNDGFCPSMYDGEYDFADAQACWLTWQAARAQGEGEAVKGWGPKPTTPGYYLVRGYDDHGTEALVSVAEDGGDLVCNLHDKNSDPVIRYSNLLSEISDKFEWTELHPASTSAGAVPEKIDEEAVERYIHAPSGNDRIRFSQGWNAAIDAMLTASPTAPVEGGGVPEPFVLGNSYRTRSGDLVRFVKVHNEGSSYETMEDEQGVNRYTNRRGDMGRVTARPADHPGNVPPLYTHPHNGEQSEPEFGRAANEYASFAKEGSHNGEQGGKRCSWWRDMADWDGNTWEADCGACWVFIDEGPAQNEMNYCPKCGRNLSQLPAPPTEREDGHD